jgi:hypothetical protein
MSEIDDDEEGFETELDEGTFLVPAAADAADGRTERLESDGEVEVGQWYWVKETVTWDHGGRKAGDTYEWLGCVTKVGSNFVGLRSVGTANGGYSTTRVHFDEFWTTLRFEPNAEFYIRNQVERYGAEANRLMGEVQAITARLGVVPTQRIADASAQGSNALAVLSTQVDTTAYKTALVKAKDEDLPALFKKIEEANKNMAAWLTASTIPVMAQIGPMKETVGLIEDRIFTISLYAGLTEEAVKCCDGEPAGVGEKLRVMQRRLYMDEECLVSYVPGGITISTVAEFDSWIAQPENRDRLLPFPRTLAAFRVRRRQAEREDNGSLWRAIVNIQLAQADKTTFLYVRNGEQVWRIDCDFTFPSMIFPDQGGIGIEPMMIKTFAGRIDREDGFMPVREYEERLAKHNDREARLAKWMAENPELAKNGDFNAPSELRPSYSFRPSEWQLFDPTSVYYDDALKELQEEAKTHNRLATIIQGLFDRSPVLHPHPPVQTWTPLGFERAIELIYDASTLTYGEPPDFEAYRRRLNESLGPDSVTTGQEDAWLRHEAIKENARIERDWRSRERTPPDYKRYRPQGDPGPGRLSRIAEWQPRARRAVFKWTKVTRYGYGDERPASITVPADRLLNVSAYTPGDFKVFFADPRTRQEYLKWADLMLTAEDYHAGKIKVADEGE